MKTSLLVVFCTMCCMSCLNSFAQNEKLEVDGVISTSSGGVEFPDQTVQTTAYLPPVPGPPLDYADQCFMFVDGVSDTLHLVQIIQVGAKRTVDLVSGGGSNFGIPEFIELVFTKAIDGTSWEIFKSVTNTGLIQDASIHFVNENGQIYHELLFDDIAFAEQLYSSTHTELGYQNLEKVTLFAEKMCSRSLLPIVRIECWDFTSPPASR